MTDQPAETTTEVEPAAVRSRRSLLAAAAAGAAGLAASSLAIPAITQATNLQPLVVGTCNTASDATTELALSQSEYSTAVGLLVDSGGAGSSVKGVSSYGLGVEGNGRIGLYALGSAVGHTSDVYGLYARVNNAGEGPAIVAEHAAGATIPVNTAIFASVGSKAHHGIPAQGGIKLPDRSGKAKIVAGTTSVAVAVSGITSANFAIATLATNTPAHYVRAVVCGAGKITIYLNATSTAVTYASWLVLG